jgi:hypothetical protein
MLDIQGKFMRINRNMLLKLAKDTVERAVNSDHSILAIYLQGSLLSEDPLIGNTADIDLFYIHNDEVSLDREIVRVSDEVHLDIAHHSHRVYRQPRELRVHPWLGPAVYGCKIMYDPQHFIDFTQASVRGQFNNPDNVLARTGRQAQHAREMWSSFNEQPHQPKPKDAYLYLRALEHSGNAIAGLSGIHLTERRFLSTLSQQAEALHKSGLFVGFMGLLGAPAVDANRMRAWLPEWRKAYSSLAEDQAPTQLHPHRLLYYERAIQSMLEGANPSYALWPLWHTWTRLMCALQEDETLQAAWQEAGTILGLLGEPFLEKIVAFDAYLDLIEETLEKWAADNGG